MIYVAVLISILTIQAAAIVWSPSNISNGYCDQDQANITIKTDCDVREIVVSITLHPEDFSTKIVQCSEVNTSVNCFPFSGFSATTNFTNQTLEISFNFDHRQYGGKYANVRVTCQNQTQIKDHVLLIPCLSGFTTNVTRDGDILTVYCQHPSFVHSDMGIKIAVGTEGNELLQCTNNSCHGEGKRLPNGASIEVAYQPNMTLLCKMDGAVINLTNLIDTPTMEPSETTSITPSTPSTPTTQSHSGSLGVSEVLVMCSIVVSLISFITP